MISPRIVRAWVSHLQFCAGWLSWSGSPSSTRTGEVADILTKPCQCSASVTDLPFEAHKENMHGEGSQTVAIGYRRRKVVSWRALLAHQVHINQRKIVNQQPA
jgi:hypothetical protein